MTGVALLLSCALLVVQESGPDLPALLARADKILEESKAAYEDARSRNSAAAFVNAGFKLEEARIKYLVLQEVGTAALQKTAAERLRTLQQLSKLIHDGKVAISSGAAVTAPPPAAPPPPAPDAPADTAAPPPAVPVAATPKIDVLARLPVPAPAALKESEKLVKDLFKEQYAKKTPAERQALSRALLAQVSKNAEDPAACYVLLREAIDAAIVAADVPLALSSVQELTKLFDVDGTALRGEALSALGKVAKTPQETASLAEAHLKLTEEFVASDQYELAEKSISAASSMAKKSGVVPLVQRVATRGKEVSEAKSRFGAIKEQLATLARHPEHPGANLEMGQYLCYVKGNWDLGLRFLAQGPDGALKGLALRETALPTQSGEIVDIADGWAQLAEKEKSALKKGQMTAHARELFETALPGASGLLKAKIEKRLDGLIPALPAGSAGAIDLLALIDLPKDAVIGSWRQDNGTLISDSSGGSRIQLPYLLPEEYDLSVTCQRTDEEGSLAFGLFCKDANFAVVYDTFPPDCKYGIDSINAVDAWMNESTGQGRQLPANKPVTFEFRVRKTGLTTLVDGKTLIRWSGDFAKLKLSGRWQMPDKRLLFLGHDKGVLTYSKVLLTPVSGPGKKLR